MHELQAHIIALFKTEDELSTTQIVSRLFAQQFSDIERKLTDPLVLGGDKTKAKQEKAKLHRRALHHLNKLVEVGSLRITRIAAKGEKHFTLKALPDAHSAPQSMMMPIEGYEHRDVIYKYDPDGWLNKFNAVLVECTRCDSLKVFEDEVTKAFSIVNDTVMLNDFESLLARYPMEEVLDSMIHISGHAIDYDRRLCLIIDMTNLERGDELVRFYEALLPLDLGCLNYMFDMTGRELMMHANVIERIVKLFSSYRKKFNIKNDEVHKAPLGVGRAGPYTFDEGDWRRYVENIYPKGGRSVGCVQASVVVDVKRFFDEFEKASDFSDMIKKVCKAMFQANSMQRRHANEYFRQLYGTQGFSQMFSISRMAIRFWNYDFDHPYMTRDNILTLLQSVAKEVREFCHTQETIYLSCGMPLRFSIGFGVGYKRFSKRRLLVVAFDKISVKSISDIYSKRLRGQLLFNEQISELFDVGNEARFQREGVSDPVDVIREFQALLHSYKFPFFCYNFSEPAGSTVTLTSFFGDGS